LFLVPSFKLPHDVWWVLEVGDFNNKILVGESIFQLSLNCYLNKKPSLLGWYC
jgi:hypothetical protein